MMRKSARAVRKRRKKSATSIINSDKQTQRMLMGSSLNFMDHDDCFVFLSEFVLATLQHLLAKKHHNASWFNPRIQSLENITKLVKISQITWFKLAT